MTPEELEQMLAALDSAREALRAMVFGSHIAVPEGELSAIPFAVPLLAPGQDVSSTPIPIPMPVEGVDVRVLPVPVFVPVQLGEVSNVAMPLPCLVYGQVAVSPIPLSMPARQQAIRAMHQLASARETLERLAVEG